ncbi:unnamed protein product, partial [Rotaria magnacalcarata]
MDNESEDSIMSTSSIE